jgi:hypothetical protein
MTAARRPMSTTSTFGDIEQTLAQPLPTVSKPTMLNAPSYFQPTLFQAPGAPGAAGAGVSFDTTPDIDELQQQQLQGIASGGPAVANKTNAQAVAANRGWWGRNVKWIIAAILVVVVIALLIWIVTCYSSGGKDSAAVVAAQKRAEQELAAALASRNATDTAGAGAGAGAGGASASGTGVGAAQRTGGAAAAGTVDASGQAAANDTSGEPPSFRFKTQSDSKRASPATIGGSKFGAASRAAASTTASLTGLTFDPLTGQYKRPVQGSGAGETKNDVNSGPVGMSVDEMARLVKTYGDQISNFDAEKRKAIAIMTKMRGDLDFHRQELKRYIVENEALHGQLSALGTSAAGRATGGAVGVMSSSTSFESFDEGGSKPAPGADLNQTVSMPGS